MFDNLTSSWCIQLTWASLDPLTCTPTFCIHHPSFTPLQSLHDHRRISPESNIPAPTACARSTVGILLQMSTSPPKLQQSPMALKLYIHPCIQYPPHSLQPPPANKPLRIRIQGPLETIRKLLPDISWHEIVAFPQPGDLELAKLTHQALYGQEHGKQRPIVRDEYLAWAMEGRRPLE